ncbi:hypothetical protein D3C72_1595740 [compost metagenome]
MPLGPQLSIGVAATSPRASKRLDASDGARPSRWVSIRSDHPPCGRITGRSASADNNTSRRDSHSAVAAATPSSLAVSAAVAPGMAIPTWHTTFDKLVSRTSAISGSGATIQPTLQPIMRYSLETEPTVMVRSRMPGRETGWITCRPSKRILSMAASYTSHAPTCSQCRAISSHSGADTTKPVGIDGDMMSNARVRGPIASARLSGSSRQPSTPGMRCANLGSPPAR